MTITTTTTINTTATTATNTNTISNKTPTRFNELNVKEQAVIVENEMSSMLHNNANTLTTVHSNYWNILDANLISHLSNKSIINDNDNDSNTSTSNKAYFKEVKHQSNIDTLLDVISTSVNEIMDTSPIELFNTRVSTISSFILTLILILMIILILRNFSLSSHFHHHYDHIYGARAYRYH